ncbi:MAG: hypothetical protein AAGK32_07760, partial [Actinomycetota bacterium]
MANEELPERPPDAVAPDHSPLEGTAASRPAAAGRHDIVEDADPGHFWPEVDELLTIDFSRELAGLPEAGDYLMGVGTDGWDPSRIPVPPEMAGGTEPDQAPQADQAQAVSAAGAAASSTTGATTVGSAAAGAWSAAETASLANDTAAPTAQGPGQATVIAPEATPSGGPSAAPRAEPVPGPPNGRLLGDAPHNPDP